MPKGIYIDGENEINLVIPKKQSLYERLHGGDTTIETVTMKLSICLRIARTLNTLHSLTPKVAHGNICS